MNLRHDMVVVELGEGYAVAPTSEAETVFRGIIRLNSTAKDIWDGLADGLSEDEIADRLSKKYDRVDREKILKGIRQVVETLRKQGILEEEVDGK